jgi:two-component sensor histidine kinase
MLPSAEDDTHPAQLPRGAQQDGDGGTVAKRALAGGTARADELQHRVRNTLAVIRSVFARTVATGTSLEEVANHFQGRFDTISRFASGRGIDLEVTYGLEDLIWDELLRYPSGAENEIVVTGPPESLPHHVAQPLALAFHELATNAVKFGALAIEPHGGLRVDWSRSGGELVIRWQESRVPIVGSAPLRSGFGREYIEQALPYQIKAESSFALEPGGVLCTIRLRAGDGPNGAMAAEHEG